MPQFYYEDTHPAIIDKDTWECAKLEFERQEHFCKNHQISRYHNSNERFPFSGRITCGVCGHTYILIESKQLDELGRKYLRCSSFHGSHGTVIEGKTFTPPPQHTKPNDGSPEALARVKRLIPPVERDMLCTDIQIDAGEPDKAFISA